MAGQLEFGDQLYLPADALLSFANVARCSRNGNPLAENKLPDAQGVTQPMLDHGPWLRAKACPMVPYTDNPELWRDRAEEARVHAEQMSDADNKLRMLKIAAAYDRMAEKAEARIAEGRELPR